MRLFTGLSLAPHTLQQAANILAELRPTADLRWSPLANLHITTAFVGKWNADSLEDLKTALAAIPASGPIPIAIGGFGFFPNPHHPAHLFLAVKPEPALVNLARAIEAALVSLGAPRENRPYHPHVTLARIARENIVQLRFKIASMQNIFPLQTFEATAFHLYESRPTPTGSVYTPLASFPVAEGAM